MSRLRSEACQPVRLTKELLERLRVIAAKSTRVNAWYPHTYGDDRAHGMATVRGPFGRWFACSGGDNGMGDPVKHPTPVASIADDVEFCAAAMNHFEILIKEVDHLNRQIEAIKKVEMPVKSAHQIMAILEPRFNDEETD